MKFNLKNPLWEISPKLAKKRLEKELRKMIPHEASEWYKPYKQLIEEILGDE
jgi:hypothetical protein